MSGIVESPICSIYTKVSYVHEFNIGGFGAVFLDENERKIHENAQRIEEETSHSIEYFALIAALGWLGERRESKVVCFIGNESVVRQLTGEYAVNEEGIVSLHKKVKGLEGFFQGVEYRKSSEDNEWAVRAKVLARGAHRIGR